MFPKIEKKIAIVFVGKMTCPKKKGEENIVCIE
jgi:hypothetical protein